MSAGFSHLPLSGTWLSVPELTRVTLSARPRRIRNVNVTVHVLGIRVVVNEDRHPVSIVAEMDPATIDTGHATFDQYVKVRTLMDADAYPMVRWVSRDISTTATGWHADGVLRIHDRLVPTELDVFVIPSTDSCVQLHATASIDRRNLGLSVRRAPFMSRKVSVSIDTTLAPSKMLAPSDLEPWAREIDHRSL